jgi:hypothetical protein
VLTAAAENNEARAALKAIIFPNPPPQAPADGLSNEDRSEALMHARDAPADTLRGLLIKQMLSLVHHIKRCASELLFVLCDQDGKSITYSLCYLSTRMFRCMYV